MVVLTPSPAAAANAEEIARLATALLRARGVDADAAPSRVVTSPISTYLHDLVSVLRRAAVVISPDTANVHIASALGTPVIAVYNDVTDVAVWGAWGPVRHAIRLAPGQDIDDVSVDAVADALDALWRPELAPDVDLASGPAADV